MAAEEKFNSELCDKVQKDINQKIEKLFMSKDEHDRRLAQLEITFAKFESIPSTLQSIHTDLKKLSDIKPKVEDNEFWVDKFKCGVFWISVMTVGGGLAGIAFKGVCAAFGFGN